MNKLVTKVKSQLMVNGQRAVLLGTLGVASIQSVYADDVFGKAKSTLTSTYNNLYGMVAMIAGICFLVCCICAFFSSTPQGTQKWKSWGVKILIIFCLIVGGGYIFTTLKEMFGGGGSVIDIQM